MELYFWTFVVAILIFAIGSGLSLYEGIKHFLHPEPIKAPGWNYGVLLLSMVFEGVAWSIAYREFNKMRGDTPIFQAIRHSKDPTVFTVLFEDTAAMIGLFIALLGVAGSHLFGLHQLDGLASIGIGIVLAVVAVLLAIESKGLLIGEGANPKIVAEIRTVVAADKRISRINEVLTMHLGPTEILLNASLDFVDDLDAHGVETAISEFEAEIKKTVSRNPARLHRGAKLDGASGGPGQGGECKRMNAPDIYTSGPPEEDGLIFACRLDGEGSARTHELARGGKLDRGRRSDLASP